MSVGIDSCVPVLLVDDLASNLLALEAVLERPNLTILKAASGDEALELLLQHDVALALLDVRMPGIDGFELAELMRGSERTCHVPIIFITAGDADRQRRFRGYEAGAVDFIQKPIEADVLRSKANVFFDLYRQRQQIAAQRDELAAAAAALRQADRAKDRFLAVLAHELRNPIAALMSGLDLLVRPAAVANSDEVRAQMERRVSHLARLVEDLLDVSRINEGKVSLRIEPIDLKEVFMWAAEGSRHKIEAAGHRLTVNLPATPIRLEGDHTRLAQVIGNLLDNAAKYTPPGGKIDLSARQDSDEVEIRVTDTGTGISAEMQAHIFEIFAQADSRSDQTQGGLGIGLALVRQLVAMHGGAVAVESDGLGKGSSFLVRLPIARKEVRVAS